MRFEIDWVNLIVGSEFTGFALFYFVFEGNFQVQAPWGAYIWRGLFSEFYGISTTGNKVSLVNLFALLSILQDIYRSSFSDESSRNNRAIS